MGVKDLWNIVSPSCERKPLFELQGKTIAIDLSCWVVDSQTVTDNVAQPKMYLRNLYFRTVYLLMQGIWPVFVLEGKAPDLKHKEIARRNDIRRGDEERKITKKGGRSRFNTILKECETMLGLMGLKCIKGSGEAEAMCAYLNADGLVDGCISQDSDCFLYGAETVYRNFCISTQGNRGGTGGSVDEYTMKKIERVFKIGRNKMIVLALLCGCDYDEGISGVGKEAALKLFKIVDDEEILDRIKSWSTDKKFKRMELKLKDPNVCTSCGHDGKVRQHAKSGCSDCGTVSKCDDSYKETKALMSNEIALRKKALLTEGFPNQELIDEFLVRRGRMPSKLDLQWRQPKIVEFVNFMERHVCWEPEYAFAKIFSLTTRWQLRHFAHVPHEDRIHMWGTMIPERIKKIRNVRCVASYEIVWMDKDGILEGLTLGKVSDEEMDIENENNEAAASNELVSIEPQAAVLKCYPELVEEFETARLAKKKKPAKPRKKKAPLSEMNEIQTETATTTTTTTKKKTAVRRPRKKTVETANREIDEFVEVVQTLEESFEAMTIAKKRSKPSDTGTFGKSVASENFGKSVASENFGKSVASEKFGKSVASENFGKSVASEKFGKSVASEKFGKSVESENFGKSVASEKFGKSVASENFGKSVASENFGKSVASENFGKTVASEKFGKSVASEKFGKPVASGTPKKGPQFERLLAAECFTSVTNDTLGKMFDELTPDDFPSEMEDESFEISEVIDRVCGKQTTRKLIETKTFDNVVIEDNRKNSVSTNLADQTLENIGDEHEISKNHDTSDEFDIVYVPLSQRVKIPEQLNVKKTTSSKKMSLGIDQLMNDSDY